jgi:uncharacterized SAM-binding protein YcdF (DUF218 family)
MNSTWKAAIGVILIFVLGWFGGALTTMVIARHKALALLQHGPEAIAIVLERQTTRNLGLNDDQKTHLHALFVENLRQRMELQKQVQPQVKAVNRQTLQEIDAILTPDQQQRFHDNLVLFKDRFGRNPFNVGADDKSTQTATPAPATPATNSGTSQPPATQ